MMMELKILKMKRALACVAQLSGAIQGTERLWVRFQVTANARVSDSMFHSLSPSPFFL